jgi:hypothetical protein
MKLLGADPRSPIFSRRSNVMSKCICSFSSEQKKFAKEGKREEKPENLRWSRLRGQRAEKSQRVDFRHIKK